MLLIFNVTSPPPHIVLVWIMGNWVGCIYTFTTQDLSYLYKMSPRFLVKKDICIRKLTQWLLKFLILWTAWDSLRKRLILGQRQTSAGRSSIRYWLTHNPMSFTCVSTYTFLWSIGSRCFPDKSFIKPPGRAEWQNRWTSITWQSLHCGHRMALILP